MNRHTQRFSLYSPPLLLAMASYLACTFTHAETKQASLFDLSLANLMEVRVVSAVSGFEQSLEEAPASVTVVEAEEWQAMGATTLTEALDKVPGLHIGIAQPGLMFEKPIIRGLSGSFGQQVLLLIDGMPFRSPREGGAPWSQHLPLNSFKRIEVIRGSGSAIYGADAVGGIINLVSYKTGETPRTAQVQIGEHNKRSLSLNTGLEHNSHQFNLSWSTQTSDTAPERVIRSDFQSWNDQITGTSASLAPGPLDSSYDVHTLRTSWKKDALSMSYMDWYAPNYGNGAGLSQALDPNGKIKMRTQFYEANYDLSRHITGDMNIKFAWHKFHVRSKATLYPSGAILFLDEDGNIQFPGTPNTQAVTFTEGAKGNPGSDNRVVSLQLNHIFEHNKTHKTRWAIGLENSNNKATEEKNFGPGVYDGTSTEVDGTLSNVSGTDFVYLPHAQRRNYFIAVQDKWAFAPNWEATLGVRHDHYSDFGTTTNPRVGVVWKASPKVVFKAYAGSAFRAPSFVDLYSQNNPAGVGNPELTPEKIEMLDLGFIAHDVFAHNVQLETSLFQYCADDLILYVPQSDAQVTQNTGRLKVRGLEQQVKWRSSEHLSVEFGVSIIDAYDVNGADTSALPQHLANLMVHYRHNNWHWYWGGKWVAKRERNAPDTREPINDYLILDSKLQYAFDKWSLSLILNNLLNEDAREPSSLFIADDYPLEGRRASLQWTLRY